MAISTEAIRKITIQTSVQGEDQTTAALNRLAAAQDNVAKSSANAAQVTDTSSKRQLSAAEAYRRQTLSVDEGARMLDKYNKSARVVDDALKQGIITQAEHGKRIDLLKDKYGQAGTGATLFKDSLSGVSGQLIALSAGAGPVGVMLSSFGPLGLAAAAGLGGISKALSAINDGAHALAQKSIELQKFSDTTGLTAQQVQALRSAASKFALSGDEVENTIRQFTARFNELRLGQGQLLDQVRRVNPALADQMAEATDAAQALTLFGRALQGVDDVFQRNALVRAAGGRGGLQSARFLTGLDVGALTDAYGNKGLGEEQIARLARLEIEAKKAASHAQQNLSSIFSDASLQWETDYNKAFEKFTRAVAAAAKQSEPGILGMLRATGLWLGAQAVGAVGSVLPTSGKLMSEIGTSLLPAVPAVQPRAPVSGFTLGGIASSVGLKDLLTPEYQLDKQKKNLEILGSAATLTEQYKVKLAELSIRLRDAGVAESDAAAVRAKAALGLDLAIQKNALRLGQLGELASVDEIVQQKELALQKAIQEGARFSQQELTSIRERNRLLAESSKIENQLAFEREQLFRSPTQQNIEQTLRAAGIPPQSERAKFIRDEMQTIALLKDARDAGLEFTQTFVKGLLQTHDGVQALISAFNNLAAKLADKAIVDLLSGNFVQGAVEGIGAIVASIGSSLAGESQRIRKARKEWEEMQDAAKDFADTMAGVAQNDLTQQLKSAFEEGKKLFFAAIAAQDYASALRLYNEYQAGVIRMTQEFVTEQFNAAQGRGYLNQINDLIKQTELLRQQAPDMGNMIDTIFTNNLQKIIDDAGLTGDAFNELHDIFKDLPASIHASTQALEEQKRAQEEGAKSIVDYLSSLTAGSASTLSPKARLAAAQSAFGAKLSLAQGGDASALGSITQDAENLRQAAQAMYGSAAGYQSILTQIKSSLLALPAVKETTDPVTQAIRDVLLAIEVGNAAQATDATLTGTVLAAITAGSAVNVANALGAYFDAIDKNTDGLIDFDEMKKALGGMASDAALRDMFTRLDVDKSGSLSRLELLNASTQSVSTGVGTNNTLTGTTNTLTASGNDVLTQIKALNDTQAATLALLNGQFSTSGISVHPTTFTNQTVTLNNNMLTALNKIDFNTYAISKNTQLIAAISAFGAGAPSLATGTVIGAYAEGGTIPPYGVGLVSEHLNPTLLRAGPEPIHVFPGSAAANDNGAMVAELRSLKNELQALRAQVAAHMRVDEQGHTMNAQAVDRQTNRLLNKQSLQASRPATPGQKVA